MEYSTALNIYKQISESGQKEVLNDLVLSAVEYARIRTDWYLSDKEKRIEMNDSRRAAHNVLIDNCNILSRAMAKASENISWYEMLGEERVDIGDFACYIHCIIGIKAG